MAATSSEEEEPREAGNVESGPAVDEPANEPADQPADERAYAHEPPAYLTQPPGEGPASRQRVKRKATRQKAPVTPPLLLLLLDL